MDNFFTEEAAQLAGLKLTTFTERARKRGIKPAEFVKSDDGGRPKARWTMAQIEEIKNLRGNKRTQPKEQPTVVDTVQAAAPIVEHAKDTSQIITLEERADRIRKLQADVQRGIIEIGFELIAAKNEIGHGGWSDWLATNFDWTQQTANRFMRVSERFGKLNNVVQFKPSTLQAMLALPEGDEQAFIAEQAESGKPLEKQSARQVQASVKQWKKKRAEETTTPDTIEEIKGTYFDLRGSEENSSVVEELNNKTPVKAPITFNTQSGNCEYYTPHPYIEAARRVLGKIDLDPASSLLANETVKAEKIYTVDDDGLAQEWFGNIWLNPPYASGLIERFVDKLLSSNFQQAIVLVDNATETRWFRKLVDNCAALVFTTGRINFNLPDGKPINGSPTRGQVFLYFGTDTQKFFDEFQQFGWCSKPQRQLEILSLVESELGELQKNTTDDGGLPAN